MSTIRIMLVEDDLDYRYLIEQALRREADFELCTSCTDGKSAVQTALMEQPDIVLMDLCLAHSPIDGAEAFPADSPANRRARHHPHLARGF